jgi:TolB-like protein/tetratricopeptide (TPR) repeat protein
MSDPPASNPRRTLEFGEFRLDPAERVLSLLAGGPPIPLTPRAFDVLCYLLEHAGQLIEKEALIRAIWPRVVVDENNLSQHVSSVRRALGDGRPDRRYVLTVPGRGYRFVAVVRVGGTAERSSGARAGAAAAPSTATAAVAVLPFANLSGDASLEYFSDGMTDELINGLTRVPGLRVISRTSSFAYKGRNIDVRDIGRDLGVGLILEGSARKSADRIRVTAQLVDAETGYHRWSQTYERSFADLFALEDELVAQIVRSIGKATERPLSVPLVRPAPTNDLGAYQTYLEARAAVSMPTRGGNPLDAIARARDLYDRAIVRDPQFARAYAGRASMKLVLMGLTGASATWEALADVEADAERALTLDAGVTEAIALLGVGDALRWRWAPAEERFRAAYATEGANPITSLQHAAFVALPLGHHRAALQEIRDAYAAAPMLPEVFANLAAVHWVLGLDTEAVEYSNLVVDLFRAPKHVPPFAWVYSCAALRAQRFDEAGSYMTGLLPPSVQARGGAQALRNAYASLADSRGRDRGLAELRKLRALVEEQPADVYTRLYLAVWFTVLGALDDAYAAADAWIEHSIANGPAGLALVVLWIPEMAAFRADRRFTGLASRLRFTDYWDAYGPPDNHVTE